MMPPIMGWFRTSPASGDYAEFLMPSGNILTVFYRLLPWRARCL
jgi:hypothetical protein